MRRSSAVLLALLAVGALGGVLFLTVRPRGANAVAPSSPPPAVLAVYEERAPHVLSELQAYSSAVRPAPATPAAQLLPVPPASFNAPVAAYREFAGRQLGLMETQVARLHSNLVTGDRAAAQDAWRRAYAHYLELGAVYLEGPIAQLNQAIDGTPGGVPGGTASPQFTGLHRIELGLWTGAPLQPLVPYAVRLAADVHQLRQVLPQVSISPLDYATRAHEILEDAVRDLLSGTDAPWSGEGVLGTAAGLDATREVVATLRPLLLNREGVLPVVDAQLQALQVVMSSLRVEHGGRLPTNGELTKEQSERLDNAMGAALEALAQVPGALEAAPTPTIPQIPASDARVDPT